MYNRALGKYSLVQHEMLVLCSVGRHVTDSKTNLEHALTVIQCLNVSVGNNELCTENRESLFLRVSGSLMKCFFLDATYSL